MQIVLLPITTYKLYVKLKVFHLPFFISGVLAGLKPIFTVVFLSMKIWQEESGGIAAPAALLPPAWSGPVQALEMSRGRHHNCHWGHEQAQPGGLVSSQVIRHPSLRGVPPVTLMEGC